MNLEWRECMLIYILALMITILLIWILEKKVKSQKVKLLLMILAVVPLFMISAIRYDVGTDYLKRYTNDYISLAHGGAVDNLEIGFKLIVYICLIFTKEPYLLFVVTSFIILSLFFQTIYKKSTNVIFSILIFFLGGYFFASLNLVRQYMAIAFILLGYQFLMSDNKRKAYIGFLACAIIAFSIHSASIVSFVILLLSKKVLVNAKWVLPCSILILFLNEKLMACLSPIIEQTRFNVYLTGNMAKGETSILSIVKNLVIYVWMYGIYVINAKQKIKLEKEGVLFLNIQGIALLMIIAGTIHMQFLRIAIYFEVFQILSVPYYLTIMPFKDITSKINQKINKDLKEKTIKIVAYVTILLCFIGMFSYTNILNNDNEVLPYKTIFSPR